MNEKQLRAELDAVYQSASWRITAPLRLLSKFVQRFLLRPLSPRRLISTLVTLLLRQTALVSRIKRHLHHFPRVQISARRFIHGMNQDRVIYYEPSMEVADSPSDAPQLSRASQLIYQELKRAVKRGA